MNVLHISGGWYASRTDALVAICAVVLIQRFSFYQTKHEKLHYSSYSDILSSSLSFLLVLKNVGEDHLQKAPM